MILYNCVIFALVSFHVAHNFVLKLAKVIFKSLIKSGNFFLETITGQVIMPEAILNMTESKCRVGSLKDDTALPRTTRGFLH